MLTVWLLPWLRLPGVLLPGWPVLPRPDALLVRESVVLLRLPRLVVPPMLAMALLRVLRRLAVILSVRQSVFPPNIRKAPIAFGWRTFCAHCWCTGVIG